jgi:hypothetical protein
MEKLIFLAFADVRELRGLEDEPVSSPLASRMRHVDLQAGAKSQLGVKPAPMRPRASAEQLATRLIVRTVRSNGNLLSRESKASEIASVPAV